MIRYETDQEFDMKEKIIDKCKEIEEAIYRIQPKLNELVDVRNKLNKIYHEILGSEYE